MTTTHDEKTVKIIPPSMGSFALRVIVVIFLVAIAAVIWKSTDALLLLFAAIFVALVLRTLAEHIQPFTRLNESVNIVIATLLIVLTVVGVFAIFGNLMSQQIQLLVKSLPEAYEKLGNLIGQDRLSNYASGMIPSGATIMSSITAQTANITNAVSGLLLAVLGGIYLALDPNSYTAGFSKLLPRHARKPVAETLIRVSDGLRHWLTGQLVVMVVVGVSIAIGLSLIGLPAALALGLIACVLEFIPVVGPILSAVPALLIALTVDVKTFVLTAVVFLVVQQIEGNFLSPAVMRRAVAVPSALSLFALYFFGEMFGPIGVILGGPLTVASYIMVRQLWMKGALHEELPEDHPAPAKATK